MVSTRASSKRKRSTSTDLQEPEGREHDGTRTTRLNKLHKVESHSRAVVPSQKKSNVTTSPQPHSSTSSHPTIFTIGHGTRTLSTLIDLLQSAHITKLVDVRSFPRSYTNPQFNRDTLAASTELNAADIEYTWCGAKLGGRRSAQQPNIERHTAIRVAAFRNYAGYMSTESFRDGLEELKALAEKLHSGGSQQLVAIMCSETLWWRCHRRMIADALVVEGWDAQHLGVKRGEAMKHVLWDIARIDDNGKLIYDVKS